MISDILLGGGIGALLALILTIPAFIHEFKRRKHDNPILLDIDHFGGRKLNDRESFALGVLVHILIGIVFGVLYPLNPDIWTFAGETYSIASLAMYALVLYGVASIIIFPITGMGLFGWKEDKSMWFELLFTLVLLVVGFWLVVGWFQPSWF